MKMMKMALAGALLFAVTSVQANTLLWGAAWAYSYTSAGAFSETLYGDGIQNGTAWLVVMTSTDTSGISVNTSGQLTATGSLETFTQTGWNTGFNGTAVSANVTPANYYAVVVYDSSTKMYGISGVVQGSAAGMADGPPPTAGSFTFGNNAIGGGNFEGADNTFYMRADIQAVPEPTSMALLALGVAALGLRRKFRK